MHIIWNISLTALVCIKWLLIANRFIMYSLDNPWDIISFFQVSYVWLVIHCRHICYTSLWRLRVEDYFHLSPSIWTDSSSVDYHFPKRLYLIYFPFRFRIVGQRHVCVCGSIFIGLRVLVSLAGMSTEIVQLSKVCYVFMIYRVHYWVSNFIQGATSWSSSSI
jgi:hypothetical protein